MTRSRPDMIRRENAFTLLELLVAAVITAVLMSAMVSAFHVALTVRENGQTRIEDDQISRLLVRRFLRDLESLASVGEGAVGEFTGDAGGDDDARRDTVAFVVTTNGFRDGVAGSDLQRIQYEVQDGDADDEGRTLVRIVYSNLLGEAEEPVETVLLKDVSSFALSYFDGDEWLDSWGAVETESALPEAVRLTLVWDRAEDGDDSSAGKRIELVVPVTVEARETDDGGQGGRT